MNTDQHPTLVLASSSAYRRQQLETRLGLQVLTIPPATEEQAIEGESPSQMAQRLSLAKALSVAQNTPPASIIIAGDQTAQWHKGLLRKPGSHKNAVEQLCAFSGQEIRFHSGICVFDTGQNQYLVDSVTTTVRLRTLSRAQVEYYVERDKPADCLGAFKNEALGIALFESVESLDSSALTGLPLITLCTMLRSFGLDVLSG